VNEEDPERDRTTPASMAPAAPSTLPRCGHAGRSLAPAYRGAPARAAPARAAPVAGRPAAPATRARGPARPEGPAAPRPCRWQATPTLPPANGHSDAQYPFGRLCSEGTQ